MEDNDQTQRPSDGGSPTAEQADAGLLKRWEAPKLIALGEISETAGGDQTHVAESTGGFLTIS